MTPATITLTDADGVELGHVVSDGNSVNRWHSTCGMCEAPGLRPVTFPATALQMLLAHLESAHKEAAA